MEILTSHKVQSDRVLTELCYACVVCDFRCIGSFRKQKNPETLFFVKCNIKLTQKVTV